MRALLISSLLSLFAVSVQAAPQISAQLQPDEIALGQSARLVVTLSATGADAPPNIPEVDGLSIRPAGRSSQIRIINGQTSRSIGFNYHVTPERAGEFEIPAIAAPGGGARTDPLELTVNKSSNALPQGLGQNQGAQAGSQAATADLAFLRIDRAANGERDHLYVGELTPIAIRAFFREGVQISQLSKPAITGGAFTLHKLSEEPQQQTSTIDGKPYRVLTWLAGLSGVKAGDEKLAASLEATIGIPAQRQPGQRRAPQPFGGGFFDDPFFDSAFDSFFQRVEQREVTLTNEPVDLAIKTLPSDDRPAGFDGAVGQFKLGSFTIPTGLETGNPTDLKVTVTGKGNFDRVTSPRLVPADKWKTYSAKAESDPADRIGWEASKSFTLPAIALEPGNYDVGFSFDYFDPEEGVYKSITSEAIPVEVTGTAVSATEPAAVDGSPSGRRQDELAPLRDRPGLIFSDAQPLYRRPWFIAAQAVPASAMLAALAIGIVRRRRDDPDRARRRATSDAIKLQLEQLATARQKQDGGAFFACARQALQHKLAAKWDCHPESITTGEVSQKLPRHCEALRIFNMADAVEFSGARPDPDAYGEWQERVQSALAQIDSPPGDMANPAKTGWGEAARATHPL